METSNTRVTELWLVKWHNELDSELGYSAKEQTLKTGLAPAVAKSIARHLNKTTPWFVTYTAEEEPQRWW